MLYESANAKINLFLEVTGRRPDGYHELQSCMQTVDLSDTIGAELLPPKDGWSIRLSCSDASLPCNENNLAYRAAALYMEETGIHYDLRLHIEKRIPLSAGLGGGSADAAAVLRLLNQNSPHPLSSEALCALGRRLGADVPFCITGGTCRCGGIGDELTPVAGRPDYTVLVAKAGLGVSTPQAFALLDEQHDCFRNYTPRDSGPIYDALTGGDVHALAHAVYNIFEDAILPIRPAARELKEFLDTHGAICSLMSGSGPSVFGIFTSDARAMVCAATLKQRGIFAAACRTVG